MRRRRFLGSLALLCCARGRGLGFAPRDERKSPAVDVHAHAYVPDDWPLIRDRPEAKELEEFRASSDIDRLTNVDSRIAEMDRQGIAVQAVSLYVGQYYYWADAGLAEKVVRVQNRKLQEICASRPKRLVGLGAVSLHIPELAAEQAVEAIESFGLRGFMITGSVNGEEISVSRFDPFWKKVEELDSLVFIHPRGFAEGARRFGGNGWLSNTVGNPLETTVALSHMIFDGFLDRFPRVQILAAHGGGYLPSYIGRSDNCHAVDPRCRHMEKKPSEYLRRFYFDTLVYSPRVLRHLIEEVGADRVVAGTDYPFAVASRSPVGDVTAVAGLGEAERAAILGGTAARLLKVGLDGDGKLD
jgi:aminocarboxymuconate-semialdehyde decarboxylase